jgi:serine/threonine-protein kinase
MGEVYLAMDRELGDRKVAVKCIRPEIAENSGALERFRREALAQSRVRHPNLVQLYDAEFEGPCRFLTMEAIEGTTLASRLAELGALPWEEVCRFAEQLGSALDALHDAGILHRDIKPQNLMVRDRYESLVLMDLGLVQLSDSYTLTKTGMLIGTPLYLPPEIFRAEKWSARSDQWQMAACLFEAASGETLLQSRDHADLLAEICAAQYRDLPPDLDVPEEGRRALAQGYAALQEERFSSCTELARALPDEGAEEEDAGPPPEELAPSAAPPPRQRVRRRPFLPLVVGLSALALVLGVICRPTSDGAPSPTSDAPTSTSPPPTWSSEDSIERLRSELEEAKMRWVTSTGEVRDAGKREPGGGPLLDPDPATWPGALEALPELTELLTQLGRSLDPADLPRALQRDLVDLDQRYLREVHFRPLAPLIELRRSEETWTSPLLDLRGQETSPLGGWLAVAGRALEEELLLGATMEGALQDHLQGAVDAPIPKDVVDLLARSPTMLRVSQNACGRPPRPPRAHPDPRRVPGHRGPGAGRRLGPPQAPPRGDRPARPGRDLVKGRK